MKSRNNYSYLTKLSLEDLREEIEDICKHNEIDSLSASIIFKLYQKFGKTVFKDIIDLNMIDDKKIKKIIDNMIKKDMYNDISIPLEYIKEYRLNSLDNDYINKFLDRCDEIILKIELNKAMKYSCKNITHNDSLLSMLIKSNIEIIDKIYNDSDVEDHYRYAISYTIMLYYLYFDVIDENVFEKYFNIDIFIDKYLYLSVEDKTLNMYFHIIENSIEKLDNKTADNIYRHLNSTLNYRFKYLMENNNISQFIDFIKKYGIMEKCIKNYEDYNDIFKYIVSISNPQSKIYNNSNLIDRFNIMKRSYNFIKNIDKYNQLSDKDKYDILMLYRKKDFQKRLETIIQSINNRIDKILNELDNYRDFLDDDYKDRLENLVNYEKVIDR